MPVIRARLKAWNGKFVCADLNQAKRFDGNIPLVANREVADSWETFEFQLQDEDMSALAQALAPYLATQPAQPPPQQPPSGEREQPPNIETMDRQQIAVRVDYWLWKANSNDDPNYWINVIHENKGWTLDMYWANRILIGDGAGKGYPG